MSKLGFFITIILAVSVKGLFAEQTKPPAKGKALTSVNDQPPAKSSYQKRSLKSLIFPYRPNYVLPYYHTGNTYQAIYNDATPNNQIIQNDEFKAQLSLMVPMAHHLFRQKYLSLNFAYTQLMYWQFYAKSQYFRETNYEPELFLENYFYPRLSGQLGINHQSNGRGGELERSWNRTYAQVQYHGDHWFARLRGWALVAKSQSSGVHNPTIARYLGYENIIVSHEISNLVTTVELQNLESGLRRGYVQVTLSYPILPSLLVYTQFFNGYGQSLLEYDHRTTSGGIGIAINDWLP